MLINVDSQQSFIDAMLIDLPITPNPNVPNNSITSYEGSCLGPFFNDS